MTNESQQTEEQTKALVRQDKAESIFLRRFSEEELTQLRSMIMQVAGQNKKFRAPTKDEIDMFIFLAQKKGLDPFDKQCYLVPKDGRYIFMVSIDGLRLMASRTEKLAGMTGYEWCGKDGKWRDVWIDPKELLVAARVGMKLKGWSDYCYSVAHFRSYVTNSPFWTGEKNFKELMIGKCAEALSYRRLFPAETSGYYLPEEMNLSTIEVTSIVELAEKEGYQPGEQSSGETIEGEMIEVRPGQPGAQNNPTKPQSPERPGAQTSTDKGNNTTNAAKQSPARPGTQNDNNKTTPAIQTASIPGKQKVYKDTPYNRGIKLYDFLVKEGEIKGKGDDLRKAFWQYCSEVTGRLISAYSDFTHEDVNMIIDRVEEKKLQPTR